MRVLIGCEYSGTVRDAFRALGHDAMSCDLLPTDVDGPHFQGNITQAIHSVQWDLIIMHPPCTALAVSGNRWYGEGQPKYQERIESIDWTKSLWELAISVCDKVCLENPVGVLPRMAGLPKPYYIQPWQFGHPEKKKTGLFLHALPPLQETKNVFNEMNALPVKQQQRLHYLPPSKDRWKIRSTTFPGIAKAMAEQWSKSL